MTHKITIYQLSQFDFVLVRERKPLEKKSDGTTKTVFSIARSVKLFSFLLLFTEKEVKLSTSLRTILRIEHLFVGQIKRIIKQEV